MPADGVSVLLVLDLAGVFVFALSGALLSVRARLDLFGVVVVATVTAIGGGILRDVALGITPPTSLRNWLFLAVPLVAAAVVSAWHPQVNRLRRPILLFDAAGLGLFTATGTRIALDTGLAPAGACALGVISAIGGGVLRDILLREVPLVLQREIYALAAVVGAIVVAVGDRLGQADPGWEIAAAVTVFTIRVLAVWRKWSPPTPRLS